MSTVSSLSLQIHDMTSCSICLETLNEPKVLPCIHTFCLQCLDSYCKSKSQEKEVACPLCRKVFSLPPGGIQDLPNNFFIHQLLLFDKSKVSIGAQLSDKTTLCELCPDWEAEVEANFHCIECDHYICARCSATHKKTISTKTHQVIPVVRAEGMPRLEENTSLAGNFCDQHPNEENRLYCYDCNKVMCLKCLSKHSQHKCSDVSESADKFHHLLNDGIDKVLQCVLREQKNLQQVEVGRIGFLEKIASAEKEISQKYDLLASLIQSHKSQLMEDLNAYKGKILKQIEIRKDEIEIQLAIRESFKRYCQEMMNKGTACDISRTAHDLHARAEELVKTQDEPDCHKLSEVWIMFKPSLSTTDSVKNFLGELVLRGDECDTTRNEKKRKEISQNPFEEDIPQDSIKENTGISLRNLLTKSKLLHVMKIPGNWKPRITTLGREVFLIQGTSQVVVHKSSDLTWMRNITITGSKQLQEIVSCSNYNCLYVSDCEQKEIYRHNLTNNVTTSWPVGGQCYGLSVTKTYNILVTQYYSKPILEYNTQGRLLRQISLDTSIDRPWHCVQLSTGNFVVSHAGNEEHRVCIVDPNGQIIVYYGESPGSWIGQLNTPRHLAVDKHDNVLVADSGNNRVQWLSPILTYLGDIVISGYQLNNPYTFHLDELNRRLYVGDYRSEGRMFVLGVNTSENS